MLVLLHSVRVDKNINKLLQQFGILQYVHHESMHARSQHHRSMMR